MCAWLKDEEGWVGMSSLSGIYSTPLLGVAYCLAEAQLTDACYSTSVNGPSQVYHFSRRQRDWHLDARQIGFKHYLSVVGTVGSAAWRVCSDDIMAHVGVVRQPSCAPLSLYTSSHLMYGVAVVLRRQQHYLIGSSLSRNQPQPVFADVTLLLDPHGRCK